MTTFNTILTLFFPNNAVFEEKKSENAQNADRDVTNLIKNLVRQALKHYRTEDQSHPCEELAGRALALGNDVEFKRGTVNKIHAYLQQRYSSKISYRDEALTQRIDAAIQQSYRIFNELRKNPELIGGSTASLRIAIEQQQKKA